MSIQKKKLYDLIESLSESQAEQVLKLLETFIESKNRKMINELHLNPLKYDGKMIIPTREERNAR